MGGKLPFAGYGIGMRALLPLAAFLLLTGCSPNYELDLKYDAASGSLTVAAFQPGRIWGRSALKVCPEDIIVEELTEAGPHEVWRQNVKHCTPHHAWKFAPTKRGGSPMYFHAPPKYPVSVTIFGNGWHAGTDWQKL